MWDKKRSYLDCLVSTFGAGSYFEIKKSTPHPLCSDFPPNFCTISPPKKPPNKTGILVNFRGRFSREFSGKKWSYFGYRVSNLGSVFDSKWVSPLIFVYSLGKTDFVLFSPFPSPLENTSPLRCLFWHFGTSQVPCAKFRFRFWMANQ